MAERGRPTSSEDEGEPGLPIVRGFVVGDEVAPLVRVRLMSPLGSIPGSRSDPLRILPGGPGRAWRGGQELGVAVHDAEILVETEEHGMVSVSTSDYSFDSPRARHDVAQLRGRYEELEGYTAMPWASTISTREERAEPHVYLVEGVFRGDEVKVQGRWLGAGDGTSEPETYRSSGRRARRMALTGYEIVARSKDAYRMPLSEAELAQVAALSQARSRYRVSPLVAGSCAVLLVLLFAAGVTLWTGFVDRGFAWAVLEVALAAGAFAAVGASAWRRPTRRSVRTSELLGSGPASPAP